MRALFTLRRGVVDFLLQRLSAVIIGIYVLHVVVVFILNDGIDHQSLVRYFSSPYAKLLLSITVLSIVIHGWVGMWTIGTDYLRQYSLGAAANVVRRIYEVLIALTLVAYMAWMLVWVWVN